MTTVFRNALEIGSRVDRYAIEAVIGHGGFGISYRAVDTGSGERVALKEYLPSELATREADDSVYPLSESHSENFQWGLERFLDEVQLLAQFIHPNIVRVERAFKANGTAYMVMDFEDGESLAARLKRDGGLANEALTAMIMPLLDGLELVHGAGFIHRDIKPSNIYLRHDGSPVLLDFGSARQALKGKTRTLTALVSAGYAPLEQYFSRSDLQGPWTDIYGLGATLYHAISGEAPIDAVERSRGVLGSTRDILAPVAEVAIGDFPPCLLAAVDHALRVDDQDRPRSIGEWRRELTGEIPVPESPVTTLATPQTRTASARLRPPPGIETARPSRRRLGLAAAVVAIAIGALGWWQWPARDETGNDRAIDPRSTDAERRADTQIAALRKSLADSQAAASVSRRQIDELTAKLRKLEIAQAGNGNPTPKPVASDDRARARQRDALVDELKAALEAANAKSDEARRRADELAARLRILEALQNRGNVDDATQRQEIDTLLAAAENDIRRLRMTTPAGDNAYERYRRVLELEEDNAAAQRGLERIVEKYIELANRARDEERFDDAQSYLARASSVLPSYATLVAARKTLEDIRRNRQPVAGARPEFELPSTVAVPTGAEAAQTPGNPGNASGRKQSEQPQAPAAEQVSSKQAGVDQSIRPVSKTSIAVVGAGQATSPAPLRTVIFPTSAGGWSLFTHTIVPDIVRQLTKYVRAEDRLTLSYSFYADGAPGQTESPTYWNGFKGMKKPDIPAIVAAARKIGADVAIAVFHWNTDGQTSHIFATSAKVHMIDVASQSDYVEAGNGARIAELAGNALSRLEAARSVAKARSPDSLLN